MFQLSTHGDVTDPRYTIMYVHAHNMLYSEYVNPCSSLCSISAVFYNCPNCTINTHGDGSSILYMYIHIVRIYECVRFTLYSQYTYMYSTYTYVLTPGPEIMLQYSTTVVYVASPNCPYHELNTDTIDKNRKSFVSTELFWQTKRNEVDRKQTVARSEAQWLEQQMKSSSLSWRETVRTFPFRSAARSTIKHSPSCIKAQSVAISNSPLAAKAWFTMPFFYDVRSRIVLAWGA